MNRIGFFFLGQKVILTIPIDAINPNRDHIMQQVSKREYILAKIGYFQNKHLIHSKHETIIHQEKLNDLV